MTGTITIHSIMTNPKQSAIRKAYGPNYEACNPDEDGWSHMPFEMWHQVFELFKTYPFLNEEDWDIDTYRDDRHLIIFRPKSLRSLDHNNGWTRLESADDLPEKGGVYIWLYPDGVRVNIIYDDDEDDKGKQWFVRRFTHWRPIVEIPGPVY